MANVPSLEESICTEGCGALCSLTSVGYHALDSEASVGVQLPVESDIAELACAILE